MKEKSLELLVNENVVYAKVLDYFGVKFYESRDKTLTEVCSENGIDEQRLIAVLEKSTSRRAPEYLDFRNYSVRLIVEYLKHSHQIFVKDTLPYLLKMIAGLEVNNDPLVEDLKMAVPMFVEDFIRHIYEEEDSFFSYVCELEKYVKHKTCSSVFIQKFGSFSIQEFALHHNDSDDELKGIRGITDQFASNVDTTPQLKVILEELKCFDEELTRHANIENDILFPKALSLEKEAKELLNKNVRLN